MPDASLPLSSGTVLGHYRIGSPLGTGGMGTVYLAEDIRLRRQVAVKILRHGDNGSDHSRRRILREARAAAKLDHPNICAVYDVSEADDLAFIVMQYVEGETLDTIIRRRPLESAEAIKLAPQIADAIAEAHARGVIHRDLKPSNVMVTSRGQAKVMDFGLAQVLETPEELAQTETHSMTATANAVEGTLPYMSPEQLRGNPTDARSDVFSFGVLLYEALSGRRPFEGSGTVGTVSAILSADAIPLDERVPNVAPEFVRIVHKAIDKDPTRRYQSFRDLAVDLHRLEQPGAPLAPATQTTRALQRRSKRTAIAASVVLVVGVGGFAGYSWYQGRTAIGSIAVMPIVNGADAGADYLSEGMTNDVILRLSEIPALKVMSSSAVFNYKASLTDAKQIGRDLGVAAVLFGRMTKRGDTLDFQLQLVNAGDASIIWGQHYERPVTELVSLQREIPLDISTKLRQRLGTDSRARLSKTPTQSGEAYELYLRGRYEWERWTKEGAQHAIEFYNRAIAIDSSFALAYAGIADATLIALNSGVTSREVHVRARDAALKAMTLDPDLAEPHTSLASVLLYADWDFAGAEREYKKALALNPSCAECHHLYSHLLMILGRFDESLGESRRLLDLDPISETPVGHLANHYLAARNFPAAIAQYKEDRRRFPDGTQGSSVGEELGDSYYFTGRMSEAVEEYVRAARVMGASAATLAAMRAAYTRGGMDAFWRKRIELLEAEPPNPWRGVKIAAWYARLNQSEPAIKHLDAGYAAHDDGMVTLKAEPSFEILENDPRYIDILRRVGLPR